MEMPEAPNLRQNLTLQTQEGCAREKERIKHLNAVLHSIREVNRLIIKGKDRKSLIQSVCKSLVKNRGYHNAWIILLDENFTIQESAEAGLAGDLKLILDRIRKGDLTFCCRKVLMESGFIAIDDPFTECTSCPMSQMYNGRGAMSASLTHEDTTYGILTVSVPTVFSADPEEQKLFTDVADDIAFGLHSIQVEKQRRRTETALRETRDKLELRVKERTQELEELSFRLISAQEEERKRIAGDLHDGIGQCLSAVKFIVESSLEQLNGKVPATDLNALRALIPLLQESSEEVRNIVMNLRPSILDDLGIRATIGWFCRQFKAVYAYIQVEEKIELAEEDIPDSLKTILFRILQEAMNNVVKHSQADRVVISLKRKGRTIELTIQDNGRGFEADRLREIKASEKGFGITGMKERAELSGGRFEVDSASGRGTVIRATWAYTQIRPM